MTNAISANIKGCHDVSEDPHASQAGYAEKVPGLCRDKRALTAFYFFALCMLVFPFGSAIGRLRLTNDVVARPVAWMFSLGLTVRLWRDIRRLGPRDQPFIPPVEQQAAYHHEAEPTYDAEQTLGREYDAYEAAGPQMSEYESRPSMTGLHSDRRPSDDPLPSDYGPSTGGGEAYRPAPPPPVSQPQPPSSIDPFADPRTVPAPPVYEDPYERIRASFIDRRT